MRGVAAPGLLDPFFALSTELLAIISLRDGTWVRVNPALLHLLGWGEEAVRGQPVAFLIHPEDVASLRVTWTDPAHAPSPIRETRVRRSVGDHRRIAWFGSGPSEDGLIHLIGRDVTDRPHGASRPDEGTDQRRPEAAGAVPLLAEVQHRTRNTIGVIRAIARRTARTSETVDALAAHLDGRIGAFARVQSAVMREPSGGLSLPLLVADELAAVAAREGDLVDIIGPPVRLRPKAAETFGLAVHELATNAVEHGALAAPEGRVGVTWTVGTDGGESHLLFCWRESGLRDPPRPPTRRGFGMEHLERTLAYELQATTRWALHPAGLVCEIDVPFGQGITHAGLSM